MPEVEPLRFPSREGGPNQQDQGDLQAVCPGRRRSCALVNTPSPCVNKAIYHIQELKRKVENWCQQSGKFQPQMTQDKHQYSKTLRFQPGDSDTESMISTELYIEGIGLSTREGDPLSPLQKEMTDVLVEVVNLIERLEADRQDAEEALQKEKRRKRTLENKVDSLSLWKQQEYPLVVQKEHEACIRDITELKWHLKLKREKLDQVQEKMLHLEVLNQRLHEDIGFIEKHAPLVKEKLEFETGVMNQISTAQAEADKAYTKTHNDLKAVEKELKEMELEANNEKGSMNCVLRGIKNQLANRLEELKQLKTLWEVQCAKVKDAEQSVALKEKECAAILQCIPEMKKLETTANDRVLELKIEIDDEAQKIKKLQEQLTTLQEDIQKTKRNGEEEVSHLEELLHSKRKALVALHEENLEYELEVEDYKKKTSESEKAVKQMHKDRKQMLQKISENEEQRDGAKEEVTQVVAQHSATKARLEEQEQLTFMEEQRARKATENLRKELMGEMNALALLKSQCGKITEELHQEQRNSELANQKLQMEFEAASSATKDLDTGLEELRKLYNDKFQKIKILTEKLEEIQCEHRNTLVRLEKEKKLKFDHLNAVKELHTATIKRYDYTLGRISDLTEKCTEYRDASDKMEKISATMPDVIEELQSVFDVVEFKHQSAALIMNSIQSDTNNCLQRTQQSTTTHTAHFAARQMKMEDTKEALKIALKENTDLAREYTDLQKSLMEAKQEAVCVFSEKNRANESFHYHTQLSLLQKRMHKAMVKYFKQRSLYSQAELDHCQALSQDTNQKIKTAQGELSEAIQRISAFLQSLTDDSTTTDDAGVNKQASPDAVGLNE
uniref:coiled-coil domain-containing protein 178 n=1 Tax=Centroberyx gerrardi TaxID=166262 RepID=UPI003AAA84F5